MAGYAGKKLREILHRRVARIYGLDPAGPLFNGKDDNWRLSKHDGKLVGILHTDSGKFGYEGSLGALDFYANSGTAVQPGCIDFENSTLANATNTSKSNPNLKAIFII